MTVDELLKEAGELFARKDFRRLKRVRIRILNEDCGRLIKNFDETDIVALTHWQWQNFGKIQ